MTLISSLAIRLTLALASVLAMTACSQMPIAGPTAEDIRRATTRAGEMGLQIVDLDDSLARRLAQQRRPRAFSDVFGQVKPAEHVIGTGDALEVSIWEAPPATLFGGGLADPRLAVSTARPTALPEQVVDERGLITVPFAGRIPAAGRTLQALEADIAARLRGKANQPEVIVRTTRNASSTVTVVGEVTTSLRVPLTAGGERLLDALAAAGGVRQPVNKTTVQVTRGQQNVALPLDQVIRDPRQNISMLPGDVVTAMFQPLSFTAMGATGKNEEINFEAQGISLAQALARAGGLVDSRADAQGVFVFRFENLEALDWPRQPVLATAEGTVPVVYRIDLRDPASFFVMQNFAVNNRDIVYVSNAPLAELQKFLNLMFSVAFPVLNAVQVIRAN